MFKIKCRQMLQQLKCSHKNYRTFRRECGTTSFIIYECLDCNKTWVK